MAVRPCYAVVEPPAQNSYEFHYKKYEIGQPISFVKAGLEIHKAGKLHDCITGLCAVEPHQTRIRHAYDSPVSPGTRFFIKSRTEGYPPRRG